MARSPSTDADVARHVAARDDVAVDDDIAVADDVAGVTVRLELDVLPVRLGRSLDVERIEMDCTIVVDPGAENSVLAETDSLLPSFTTTSPPSSPSVSPPDWVASVAARRGAVV